MDNESMQDQLNIAKRATYSLLKELIGIPFYSQATQDVFACSVLSEKRNGYYLEIGGGHPKDSSNTFLLESAYNFSGLTLDMNPELVETFKSQRKNLCIQADAVGFDYTSVLSRQKAPAQIDYLSLDVEPASNTFAALRGLPHEKYRFSVITYEHDRYQSGDSYMNFSRSFLVNLGYQLVVSNLRNFGRDFEDWWIDPSVIREELWAPFKSESIEFHDLWIRQSIATGEAKY